MGLCSLAFCVWVALSAHAIALYQLSYASYCIHARINCAFHLSECLLVFHRLATTQSQKRYLSRRILVGSNSFWGIDYVDCILVGAVGSSIYSLFCFRNLS